MTKKNMLLFWLTWLALFTLIALWSNVYVTFNLNYIVWFPFSFLVKNIGGFISGSYLKLEFLAIISYHFYLTCLKGIFLIFFFSVVLCPLDRFSGQRNLSWIWRRIVLPTRIFSLRRFWVGSGTMVIQLLLNDNRRSFV